MTKRKKEIQAAPVKAPAFMITLGSVGAFSLTAAVTAWKKAFEEIFGAHVSSSVRETILVASIAAIVVVASSDMFARAIAVRHDARVVAPWAKGWHASISEAGPDATGYVVAAARVSAVNPNHIEYLLVKDGAESQWQAATSVQLQSPSNRA